MNSLEYAASAYLECLESEEYLSTDQKEEVFKTIYEYSEFIPGIIDQAFNILSSKVGWEYSREEYDQYVREANQGSRDVAVSKQKAVLDHGSFRPMHEQDEEVKKLSFIPADKLLEMDLEAIMFVVDGMIPAGLSIVASPPKYGKSWFVLDMCISVADGSDFLGHKTNQCETLYLSLEDSNNRLQDRIKKVLNERPAPAGFAMSTEAADLGHGLIDQLDGFLKERPDTKLIVIDTFEKIRADAKYRESAYTTDYREAGLLKGFADQNKIALVLVHHTRKMKDYTDAFANVSGTHGLTGAADTTIVMEKETRSDNNTKLSITGRDVAMEEFQIDFKNYKWHIIGTVDEIAEKKAQEEYNNSHIVITIKKLLQQNREGWTGTATDLINASKYFHVHIFDNVQKIGRKISEMAELLYQNDNIIFEIINNGTGSKRYKFYYDAIPFEDDS